MTLSRTEEIRQVASEWEFENKRIHAPAPPDCLKELLRRVDEPERGIGQMRLIAGLPLPPDVAAKVAEADRLRKLFDDAGEGQYNVLNLVESYQRNSMERTSASVWFAGCSKKTGAIARATTTRTSAGPTAKCARVSHRRGRSGSEFVQSNECANSLRSTCKQGGQNEIRQGV